MRQRERTRSATPRDALVRPPARASAPRGLAVILALSGLGSCAPAGAAAQEPFRWEGELAGGRTLEIRGVNGGIDAMSASGDRAEVVAEKRAERSDPGSVEIRVVEHDGGVTICAVYPAPSGRAPNGCRPGGGGSDVEDNDVVVDFTVRVPSGVHLEAHTVNGEVAARGLDGDVTARTVNGSVDVSATGTVRARTVNGAIDAAMGRLPTDGTLRFETVNGGITLRLPAGAGARVRAETLNGHIDTDFPLTVQGRWGPRTVNGTIGEGGPELRLKTVNGGITLRRAG